MSIEIVNKTKQAMEEAYQNREHEALQHVAELLQEYQKLLQQLADQAQTDRLLALLSAVKTLLESYQMQDLLGIADTLYGRILPVLDVSYVLLENPERSTVATGIPNLFLEMAADGKRIFGVERENRKWYLNSRYDTEHAAALYAGRYQIRAYGTYFIFGLSDGRHVREFLKKCDDTNHIVICEPDAETYKACCEQFDISDIQEDKRVHFYIPNVTDRLENIMKKNLQYSDFAFTEFCILPGYDILFHEECEEFQNLIIGRIRDDTVKKGTSLCFQRAIPYNTLYNMKHMIYTRNIEQIRKALEGFALEEIPAVIVCAGPSLDKNIQELKKAEGRALIIVVDAALRAVLRAGIRPDLVCTVDPNPPERFFTDLDLSGLIWCCENVSKPEIIRKYGERVYYFGYFEKGWNQTLSEMLGYEFPVLPTGGSVSSIAFAMALYFGFRKIVFMGQDLAFTGGKSHTSGIAGALGDNDKYIKSRCLMEVEGIDGTMLQTDFQMWYYKQWFEKAIRDGGDRIRVIDATEGGARIEGAENRKMSEVVCGECLSEFDFQKLEQAIPLAFSEEDQQKLEENYRQLKFEAEDLQRFIEKQINVLERLCQKNGSEADALEKDVCVLRDMLKENDILENMPLFNMMITYAQKAEYELGDTVYANVDMGTQDLARMNLNLLLGYQKATQMLLEDIEENLSEESISDKGALCI